MMLFLKAFRKPNVVETKPVEVKQQDYKEHWYEKEFEVTAYCPCSKCCGRFADGNTASGYKIEPNDVLIAAPKRFPFGTVMYIPDYGYAEVKDRGGAIDGNRLDVFFHTHQEALNWGRRIVKVRVYK